jgi:integrase
MAGTVRKRNWVTRKGQAKSAWFVDYYDQHGIRRRQGFDSKADADAKLTTARSEVAAGVHTPDATSITIKDAADNWLRAGAIDGLERGTLRVYDQYVRIYIVPHLGTTKLSRLTAPMVGKFRNQLLAKKISRYRTGKVLTALRLIIDGAQSEGLIGQNVARVIKLKKASKRERRRLELGRDVPQPDEMHAMVQHATGRDRVILALAAFTGMRASEMRGLHWSDVDLGARPRVHVRQRADWWGSLGHPKSEKAHRTVPLIPLVANALRGWKLATAPGPDDRVFHGRHGGVLSHTAVVGGFERAQRAAGVVEDGEPKYTPHKLRHFFASWMIDQRAGRKELQELMGHDQSTRTEDLYGHWFRDDEQLQARMTAAGAAFLPVGRMTGT